MWTGHFGFVGQDLTDGKEIVDGTDVVACVTIDGLTTESAPSRENGNVTDRITKKSVVAGLCWNIGARMRLLCMI